MLDQSEIAKRRPVWRALSDLFLDTSWTKEELKALAATIKQSGYSVDEVEQILLHEVAPVFGSNLLSVAGEWVPFDEAEVAEVILAREAKLGSLQAGGWHEKAWHYFLRSRATDWLTLRGLLRDGR